MVWCWFAFFIFFQILSLIFTLCRKKEFILKANYWITEKYLKSSADWTVLSSSKMVFFAEYSWRHVTIFMTSQHFGRMAKHLLYCHIQIKVSSLYKLVTSYPSENIKGISCNRDLESMDKTLTYEYPISSKATAAGLGCRHCEQR